MLKRVYRRICMLLISLVIICLIPVCSHAASGYYETVKANVPIWSASNSKSTKLDEIASARTVVYIVSSTWNSSGRLWYKLSNGTWVYSENVTKHSHSYTGGICNSNGCGYEWPYSVSWYSGTFQVINPEGAKIWSRPYSKKSDHMQTASYGSTLTVTGVTQNQAGSIWYRLSNGYWVFEGNVLQRYNVYYSANGGSGAPGMQYAYKDNSLKISGTTPWRSGHIFKGWSTSSGASSASYVPGGSYKFSSDVTLYAVWKACSHSSHTGGYCDTCGYELPITISGFSATYVVTNPEGGKVWSRPYSKKSTYIQTEKANTVLSVVATTKNAEKNDWYKLSDGNWIFSGNVTRRYSVTYNANGGSGAPGKQYFLDGKSVKISTTKPTRVGYLFQGWGTSVSTKTVSYKGGSSYKFSSGKTLYAVWKACGHSNFTGGYCDACGFEYKYKVTDYSATYVVTNPSGAKIWSRPYSKKSTHLRTEKKNAVFKVVAQTKNQEGSTFYKLESGEWVYKGNVTRRFSVTYNANGGKGAPKKQYFLDGASVKLSGTKPTRVGYIFQGWSKSSGIGIVSYKSGTTHKLSGSVTFYAVWKKCPHSNYTGGYCDACGFEYKYKATDYSATYVVTNPSGAKIWSRPYSKKSDHLRTEKKNAVFKVVAQTKNQEGNTFYKLESGGWVYKGNVTRRFSVTYNANGGKNAPSKQYFLDGASVKLSGTEPTRVGYVFQGWGTSASAIKVSAKSGSTNKYTSSKTLYAIWKKCAHKKYSNGYCTTCKYEYKLKITELSGTYQVTFNDGVKVYSRPYTKESKLIRTEKPKALLKVVAKTVNQAGTTYYKLDDGYWIYSGYVARRYSITYDANGGKGAPAKQYFLKDQKAKLSATKPTKKGYIFAGWGTSATAKPASAQASGATCKFTSSVKLYAIWTKCANHNYGTTGVCKCNTEKTYKVTNISQLVYKVAKANSGTTAATTYSKPFTGCPSGKTVHKGDYVRVIAHTTIDSAKWFKLKDNTWIPASMLTAASKYKDGKLTYTDSKLTSNVTKVEGIPVSTAKAISYLKEKVGNIAVQKAIPGLCKTVTRNKSGTTVTTCNGMVPQGLTFSDDYLLISSYCGCLSTHRSVIYVMDKSSKKYLTTLILDDICHVGGLAVQGGYLWVCDSGTDDNKEKLLRVYNYNDIKTAVSLGVNYWTIDAVCTQPVATTPSYMCSANGYLYVGTFYEKETSAKIYFYSTNGSKIKSAGSFTINDVPKIQGISIRGQDMIVTSSHGRENTSEVYIFKNAGGYTKDKATYTPKKTVKFANMIEGCYMGATNTYFLFESGALKYRYSPNTRPLDKYVAFDTKKLLNK